MYSIMLFWDYIIEYFPHFVKKKLQERRAEMLETVKKFCEKQKVTVEQFERVIGVSANYLYKLDKHKPGIKIARKLAVVLEIPLESVFDLCGTDDE